MEAYVYDWMGISDTILCLLLVLTMDKNLNTKDYNLYKPLQNLSHQVELPWVGNLTADRGDPDGRNIQTRLAYQIS